MDALSLGELLAGAVKFALATDAGAFDCSLSLPAAPGQAYELQVNPLAAGIYPALDVAAIPDKSLSVTLTWPSETPLIDGTLVIALA
jgi:hypothetical protein